MSDVAIAAVLGHPVSHSLSPRIFGLMGHALRRPVAYRRLDVSPGELAPFFRQVARRGLFTGLNVTLPHKEAIARLVDELSPLARGVGAVNVVHFVNGRARGHNTDVIGIRETLREQRAGVAGDVAVLYGAGGAAKAVAYALGLERARRVWIVNRTPARARALARAMGNLFPRTAYRAVAHGAAIPDEVALVVNATPAGMPGNAAFPAAELPRWLAPGALAFDLIYRPRVTSFLQAASRRGARTVNGLDMLVWQAVATWETWLGRVRDRAALKRRVARGLGKA